MPRTPKRTGEDERIAAAVFQWLARVESRAQQPEQKDAESAPDDSYVAAGADWYRAMGGKYTDASDPNCWAFWRQWARWVLAGTGLVGIAGTDFEITFPPFSPGYSGTTLPAGILRGLAGKLSAHSNKAHSPGTPESWAVAFEGACMFLDAARQENHRDIGAWTAKVATLIGMVLESAMTALMTPVARRGVAALAAQREGGRAAYELRHDTRRLLTKRFDDFLRRNPEMTQTGAANAVWRKLPADSRPKTAQALLKRVRRGRKTTK